MNAPMSPAEVSASTLDAGQSIGQLAVELPGSTAVFRRLKLDFCCGGHLSLAQAVAEKGLDLPTVLGELAQLQRPTSLPEVTEPGALIDHILTRYHEVHRANPHVPAGLGDLLEEIQAELLGHMQKEESILFPMLKSGGNPFVQHPISVMRSEHVDHGAALDKLNALTNDATPPAGACNTWRALYSGIAQLNDDLINHIHLENNVLFPAFEAQAQKAMGGGGCGGSGGGCQCG